MRIDFSWGNLRSREQLPATRVAEIVLGRHVDEQSFGPALPWLDVLFVVAGKGKARAPKALWRYPGSFAAHVIVEVPAPDLAGQSLRDSVAAFVAAVPDAVDRARPLLDRKLAFDAKRLESCVADCLRALPSEKQLRAVAADLDSLQDARRAAIERGKEALRRTWRRPLVRPLRSVRVHEVLPSSRPKGTAGVVLGVLGKLRRGRSPLADACREVGALLGGALRGRILTPGYEEIYVNVGPDAQTLRAGRTAVEDWHENAYALVGVRQLAQPDRAKLRRILFDAARDALLELADVDHLDRKEIARCLAPLDPETLSNVFEYRRVEKGPYVATLTYSLAERRDSGAILQPVFHVNVTDRAAGRSGRWPIGPVDLWETSRVLKSFALGAKDVRIDVRHGERVTARRFSLSELK